MKADRNRTGWLVAGTVVFTALLIAVGQFALAPGAGSSGSGHSVDGGNNLDASGARIGRIDDAGADIGRRRAGSNSSADGAIGRRIAGSATAAKPTNDDASTSEPLRQEKYIAALMAMMEKDGKDNALLHYALAFELAPNYPTPEQWKLINMVMEEGWDERAEDLLPYMEQWEPVFVKLFEGAHVGYARGVGPEMRRSTPGPDEHNALNSVRMMAVYSRYLESQGKTVEAMAAVDVLLSMARDFNAPDNPMDTAFIGKQMQYVGLQQLSRMADKGLYRGSERKTIDRLRQTESAQATFRQMLETELERTVLADARDLREPDIIREIQEDDDTPLEHIRLAAESVEKIAAMHLEYFSQPYWDRTGLENDPRVHRPDFAPKEWADAMPTYEEEEVRYLLSISHMRQQQIDLAAHAYMADHNRPAPDTAALVSGGYLPEVPIDPFTGTSFTYKPVGDTYDLYGSGPIIDKPADPAIDYRPVNGGVMSEGVFRPAQLVKTGQL